MEIDDDEDDDGNSGGGGGGSSGSRVWQGYIFPIGSLLPAEDEAVIITVMDLFPV